MPERVEIPPKDDQGEPILQPKRRLSASEARRRLLVRIIQSVVGLVLLVWLIVVIVGRIGAAQESGRISAQLRGGTSAAAGIESQIRELGTALSGGQLRALVAGRSLDYTRLTSQQQALFVAIRPLTQRKAPAVTPYQVRLDRLGPGRYELRLIWAVPGSNQAVSHGLKLHARG